MSKLYFYYGTMGCNKSAEVLMKYNYFKEVKELKVLLCKAVPKKVTEAKMKDIGINSRIGLCNDKAIALYEDDEIFNNIDFHDVILIDECQFLSADVINTLEEYRLIKSTLVLCYGLKTNFKGELFEGSKRLFEIADSVREIPSMCYFCKDKSKYNARVEKIYDGDYLITKKGDLIKHDIRHGGDTKYLPVCEKCFRNKQKIEFELDSDDDV